MKNNKNSVQGLIGLERFTKYGVKTDKSELAFFSVEPTNISVLSAANIDVKIHHLMMLLSTIPDLEILALDSCECFDTNKVYVKKRLHTEQNEAVRKLLQADYDFLDEIQVEIVTFDTSESSAIEENVEEKIYWYNKDGGVLTVNVNDDKYDDGICSGIGSVEITDEHNGIIDTLHSETFTENQKNTYDFPIDVSTLSEGIHHIKVEVTDNAGNNCDPCPAVKVIGVDELPPDGIISIEEPDAKEIDGNLWFDKNEIITFRVDAKPDISGIESIRLWINGIEKDFTRNDIQPAENGYFVTVDTTGIGYDYENEHKYVVTGDITDRFVIFGICLTVPFHF